MAEPVQGRLQADRVVFLYFFLCTCEQGVEAFLDGPFSFSRPDVKRQDLFHVASGQPREIIRQDAVFDEILRRLSASCRGQGGSREQVEGCLVVEVVAGLLVVQAGSEDDGIEPRGAASYGGAMGDGAEVGEGDEAAGAEGDAGEGRCVP